MRKTLNILGWISLVWLLVILLGCTKEYWLADPNYERLLLAYPPMDIHINTEPPGARVVIASLQNPQLYAAYAPTHVRYRPHPYIPSWLLIGKKGYRSTSIRLEYQEQEEINVYVVLAMLQEDEESLMDASGPYPGRPTPSPGGLPEQGFPGQGNPSQFLRQMMGDTLIRQPSIGPRK